MEMQDFTITKRDGSKDRFSLDKIMNAIIKAKMGNSESITNPQMIDLEGLMKAYLPKGFEVGTNYQLDLCAKIFQNSLAKIEFDITD